MKKSSLSLIPLLGSLIFFTQTGFAASVAQVKGTKVLIQLDGAALTADSEIYLTNAEGKKIGLAKIKAVKGDRAVADLIKGKAEAGNGVQAKSAPAVSESSHLIQGNSTTPPESSSPRGVDRKAITKAKNTGGFLAGIANNSMSLTAQYGTTKSDLSMKDTGFILKGFYDYNLTKDFIARLGTGLQMFSVKGSTTTNICDNGAGTACEVSFTYLVAEAVAQYYLTDGNFKLWAGIGYHFLIAATKKNTVPNLSSDTSTNQMITFGGGFDYWMSKNSFIPFVVQYGMFPGVSNVAASSMIVQAGYGFGF